MIGAFLVNRIPTGFVAEIATGRVAADEVNTGGRIKSRDVRSGRNGGSVRVSEATKRCARILRDVRHRHFLHFSDGSCTSRGNSLEPR
ncbi:conserved hypothetical protein [Mesorhizobium escarrei]|uniref:Uncharacterized protein n=1 Tax=Mesorhizobium escarrei TaxID=666018 RepID=A0ABN8K7W2_9HYPH|nr:conserved hypothetical protein [Mesorhizobium escarrei]